MRKKTTANKRKNSGVANLKPWPKGVSGNPAGRPKDGESWAAVIKEVSNMTTEEILAFVGTGNELGRTISRMPRNVQVKYLVTARVFAALMFEPSAGLWNGMMDRAEGKVPDQMRLDGILNIENLDVVLDKVYGNRNNKS